MATFQQIINDARVILNDVVVSASTTVPRYSEPQLLGYARAALVDARRIRPDLFLSNLTAPFPAFTVNDTVPIPEEYLVPLVDYVVSRAEMRDDEFAVDGRAASLFTKFKAGMVGL